MAIETTTSVDVKTLTPFKRFIMTLGILPTSYLESMTYAELVMWFCNFLQNEVIPAVNNNAEAVQEIQDWINTLNLQDEVDHKLDEMVESGELQEIIATYLNANALWSYDNIASLKEATNLIDGSFARTLGHYAYNDGGDAIYKIRENSGADTPDDASIIELDNGLIAELVVTHTLKAEVFGCYGDGTHDDSDALQLALNYIEDKDITLYLTKTYLITKQLTCNGSINGDNTGLLKTNKDARFTGGMLYSTSKLNVDKLSFDCKSDLEFTVDDKFVLYNNAIVCDGCENISITNCKFNNLYNKFIDISGSTTEFVNINNNKFSSDNKTNVYMSVMIAIRNIVNNKCIINVTNNTFNGFEFTYVDTLNNDYNINASGITASSVETEQFNIKNNVFNHLGKYGSISGNAGFSRLCTIDFYYNVPNANICNNLILNNHWIPIRLHGGDNTIIDNNIITMARTCTESLIIITDGYNTTGEAPIGTDNISITNNTFDVLDTTLAKGITITGYSKSDGNVQGIYGHVDNLNINNNIFKGLCQDWISFDSCLKKCYISNNEVEPSASGTQRFIKVNDANYIASTLTGADYTGTYLNIINNNVVTLGACIYLQGSNDDQKGLFKLITSKIYQNNMQNAGSGYCLYGSGNDDNTKIILNIFKGQGGVRSINKAYNNIAFYTSSGTGFYDLTTNTDNTSYLEN